ncbi:LOG family protein [Candidatus Saccharibacteria bacterium]|nr:LOG family protein [Candidatus Saccharibacteria bacterium]
MVSGKYQICVSGAAKGPSFEQGEKLALAVGVAIAKAGHSLMTGATTGLPNTAAIGYKKAGGKMSLGLSPAATKVEHVLKYRLPIEGYDAILYTGLHYGGRDALLINSADAVISVGGRLGTLHEFTIAAETHTPIGVLEGAGGIGDQIEDLLKLLPNAKPELVLFEPDPDELVAKLTRMLDKLHADYRHLYSS